MISEFREVIRWIIDKSFPGQRDGYLGLFRCKEQESDPDTAGRLNTAFLAALSGGDSPAGKDAMDFLVQMKKTKKWRDAAGFYLKGLEYLTDEIESRAQADRTFLKDLGNLCKIIKDEEKNIGPDRIREGFWKLFFPEGCGIIDETVKKRNELTQKRTVRLKSLNSDPVTDPAGQILFTSNVLLTIPPAETPLNDLEINKETMDSLDNVISAPQDYWYDHPIQIGVKPENNEFLYGLKGLEQAILFEKTRGDFSGRLNCVLSVSVTHKGLHEIARPYLEEVMKKSGGIKNMDVFVFTEEDTKAILSEVIIPAASSFLNRDGSGLPEIIGVDGEYGRHYSFLKAISFFWSTLINEDIKATFKIDLDQVFPQKELVNETGRTAFEHFKTGLWGASGIDFSGRPVELGMIAGALVNDRDIEKGLFTPDVAYPDTAGLKADEFVFFSPLPQALSTEAEMMTRYDSHGIDGIESCLERIHVTGGANGILVESLKKYRPFTPSFIGRAEDQAYILSSVSSMRERLAYVHKAGLFMRHDKESFAQDAIKSAHISKVIGDYIRILYFSSYARAVSGNPEELKELTAPFTGCFISLLPLTVVYLRFSLRAMEMSKEEKGKDLLEFVSSGAKRISSAMEFTTKGGNGLKERYETERQAWKLYYDSLSALQDALLNEDELARKLREKARSIVSKCLLRIESGE